MSRLLTALLLTLAVACGSSAGGSSTSPAARVAAILAAREALAAPAGALGTAALTLDQRVSGLAGLDPAGAAQAVAGVRGAADAVDAAVTELRVLDLDTTTADVAAAEAAALDAATAAALAASAARDLAAATEAVAAADERLEAIAATWQERGSRREQLERFAALAEDAATLEAELTSTLDTVADCADPVAVRRDAATYAAEVSLELRELVSSYRGNDFDERVEALAEDPWGTGATLHETAAAAGPCDAVVTVEDAVARVTVALGGVERALDPEDL